MSSVHRTTDDEGNVLEAYMVEGELCVEIEPGNGNAKAAIYLAPQQVAAFATAMRRKTTISFTEDQR